MKYLTADENYYCLDIECDDLNATKIWVVVVKNIVTDEELEFYEAEDFKKWLGSDKILVGHNLSSFDVPVLIRLWGIPESYLKTCTDTLVLSLLYNPALEGGHSLKAWGERLKSPKIEYSDWSKLTPEMVEYCKQDVRLTCLLYKKLTERMKSIGFSELSCEIEHKSRLVINEQQHNGFWFDRAGAIKLLEFLRGEQRRLSEGIHRLFPPVSELSKVGSFKFNKDGSLPAFLTKARDKYHRVVIDYDRMRYEYYTLEEFNIGSPKQRAERLLELGWEPENFTPSGMPKVDEDALVRLSKAFLEEGTKGAEEVQAIADWLVLQGRSSMIETWLNNLGEDSRIHGRVNSCGATTRRMTHSSPNTANIPSGAKAKYGHECRSLWGVDPDSNLGKLVLVGYDASGLETAGLCHYLNNPAATEILLRPKPDDIHTANARRLTEALGWECDREWAAKTGWYAWLYGAYPPKLGSIVKAEIHGMANATAGEIVIDTFFRNVPGLKGLIQGVQYEFRSNHGRLETIDGGFVLCPSLNAALNYKIQSAGAIVMKMAAILLDEEARKQGIPFKKVGDIHDEGQLETSEEFATRLGSLAVDSITRAGVALGFNVTLGGDFKVGKNWSETH